MSKKKKIDEELASLDISVLEKALKEEKYKRDYHGAIRNTIYVLLTVFALALLIATLIFPVIRIYGKNMSPTIKNDSLVVCSKASIPKRGSVLAFYYNNKILMRRVIGLPGDVISIDSNGYVTVNNERLEESYLSAHSEGTTDLDYPYTVPDGYYFVMADDRESGIDSRIAAFGNIQEEDFIGNVFLCIWPLKNFGLVR